MGKLSVQNGKKVKIIERSEVSTLSSLFRNRKARFATHRSTVLFLSCYLPHYARLPSAPFHYELSRDLDDDNVDLLEIIGFRDSAKSVYAGLAFPFRLACTGEKRFIVIINDTRDQVELTMSNIRYEIENNEHIKRDFPDLKIKEWSKFNVVLSNGVRIIGRSRGQNIRGIRHRQTRPDCIILDDPENLKQVEKKKTRDNTEKWFNAEVMPVKAQFGAKVVVIGNYLHDDGFIARLSKNPNFKVKKICVVDENNIPMWLAKYPTKAFLEKKKVDVGNVSWTREYMLKPIVSEDQPIKAEDIKYYPLSLINNRDEYGKRAITILDSGVGNDLAISENETADFTAMVGGFKVKFINEPDTPPKILILPNPINRQMGFDKTVKQAKKLNETLPHGTKWYVEGVQYQYAAIQTFKLKGISAIPMRPVGDKKARLESIAPFVIDGTVLFAETGCEDLINQILAFGSTEHDDLVDAFVYLIMGMLNKKKVSAGNGKVNKI